MNNSPASVAVVIRTKDRPKLLERAVDDVLAQTFTDWVMVVVNDGGPATPVDEIVQARSAALRGRCSVIHHNESLGMEAASNRGIAGSESHFVVVHDDDDTWDALFLESTVQHLRANADDVAVAVPTEVVMEEITSTGIREVNRWMFEPPNATVTLFDLLVSNRVVPIGLLIRRTVIDELGGYDEQLPVVGDWEFNLRLAVRGTIAYLAGRPLAFWHQRIRIADGALANSVHGSQDLHKRYDRLVRDRALRAHAQADGLGALLYLSKFIDERIAADERHTYERIQEAIEANRAHLESVELRLEQAIAQLQEHVKFNSPGAFLRRVLRRILRPRRDARG